MSIRFITDSAADYYAQTRPDVTIIPLHIQFGEEHYLDGVDLSLPEFYTKLTTGDVLPTTSQINPFDYEEEFKKAAAAGETVIVLALSSKLSGCCQSARIAAEDFPGQVYVVDTLSVTVGENILLSYALSLKDQGLSAQEIVDALEKEKHNVRIVALLDTLEYLQKGGRISKSAAMLGEMFSIKPVIALNKGEVALLGKARGSRKCNNLLREQITLAGGIDFSRPYKLGFTGNSVDLIETYITDNASLWEGAVERPSYITIGSSIGTHVGPGAIAVGFFAKEGSAQ